MWKRIEYMDWQTLLPQIGFILFAIAFLVVVWQVFKISKQDLDRTSRLPLEDDHKNAIARNLKHGNK